TDQNYRVAEIAETVGAAFPGCKVTYGPPSADNRSYRVDFSRIREEIPSFGCRRTAEDGARELAGLFASIGLTLEDFESRHYTRLAQLKHLLREGMISEDLFWLMAHRTP